VTRHCRNRKVLILPSLLGANNNLAEARKHNGRTKTLEFCNKLEKKFNEVKCNLTEITTRRASVLLVVSGV